MIGINEKVRQAKENYKEADTIAQILEKQGYDEVLVALGNDGLIGTSIQGKNENTPYILYKLFDDMCNADKLIFMALALGMGKENSERRVNID
ncbi:hypothetical protein [Ligilactobacillus salivarius]|uniref:Uncharacterized protein n=1 Tax=Ligilactobacillus salivarius TaxID=1624 RepID=A0A9X6XJC0_9LACO|nr:hypothetical protein [Ligilactobacillus salivarius]OTF89893.1 hypothetical protein A8C38_06075 [Ligilactobacillus salivarius]PAY27887.1 hypothetical protein A8C33_05550 [Ligilactobacillus salivarius]PAY29203.1 hypothetical protein A8C44_01770 [Ligilactobacillus salivarius]PAY29984.1 hypothetical protein A8C49_05125 [Ligilactobacillus salivarius]PAY36579.1 hypothetical protein A8C50_04925 [Ligilactobacillus salivarius]